MVSKVSVQVSGIRELAASFDKSFDASLRPAMEDIADDIYKSNSQWFQSEGGGSWAQLSPVTVATRQFPGLPILVQTRALMNSVTKPGATGSVRRITKDSVTVGTREFKAHFHQFGTSNMPARPVMPDPTSKDEKNWTRIIGAFVRKRL